MEEYELIEFISNHLVSVNYEDDIVLEVTIFVGTVVQDKRCIPMVLNSAIIQNLLQLLERK